MRVTEYVTEKGNVVRVLDPVEPGSKEEAERMVRWGKLMAELVRKYPHIDFSGGGCADDSIPLVCVR